MLSNRDQEIKDLNSQFAAEIRKQFLDLKKIEQLLSEGADANLPISFKLVNVRLTDKFRDYGTQSGSGDYQSDFGSTKINLYPLHQVKSRAVIHLLLKYGANPNLLPYSGDLYTPLQSPIEEAALAKEYDKVRHLSSYSPCTIRTNILNNAIKIIIDHADHTNIFQFDHARETVGYLMLKSGDAVATRAIVGNAIKSHSANRGFQKVLNASVHRHKITTEMAFAWVIVNQGMRDQGHWFSKLPIELILKAISHLAPDSLLNVSNTSDTRRFIFNESSEIQIKKVSIFRKFYLIMKAGDSRFSPHGFLEEASNQNIPAVRMIRNIQNKIHNYPLGSMTEQAWKLACLHYKNPDPANNNLLMKSLLNWYISRDPEFRLKNNSLLTAVSIFNESDRLERVKVIAKNIADNYEQLSSSSSSLSDSEAENELSSKTNPKTPVRSCI